MRNSNQKMKIALIKTLKWIWIGFVAMVTLEFCARADDRIKYGAPFWNRYSPDILHSADTGNIPFNTPNVRFEKWRNNNLGFRGVDIDSLKPSDKIRVVCLGTSESYGLFETEGNEWPASLAENLKADTAIQVINTSVAGLPFVKYRDYIDKYIIKINPNQLILLVNPYMYIIEQERSSGSRKSNSFQNKIESGRFKLSPANIIDNSRIAPKIINSLKKIVPQHLLKQYQLKASQKQVKEAERWRLAHKEPYDTIPGNYVDLYRVEMQSLLNYLKEHNVRPILTSYPMLMCPSNLDKYPELFLGARRFGVELSIQGMLDASQKLNLVNKEIAKTNNLCYIDLYACIPHTDDYFADNAHLTDKGASLIAQEIAPALQNNPIER